MTPLVGFTGNKLYPTGVITLPVTAGVSPRQVTKVVDFLVVNCPSANNVIIGRPTLNKMKAITLTYHLLMLFPTEEGIGEVKGNQTTAHKCYIVSLKRKESKEVLIINNLEDREEPQSKQTEHTKDLEELSIDPEKSD